MTVSVGPPTPYTNTFDQAAGQKEQLPGKVWSQLLAVSTCSDIAGHGRRGR